MCQMSGHVILRLTKNGTKELELHLQTIQKTPCTLEDKKGEIPLYSGVTEVAAKVRDSQNSTAKAMVAYSHGEWLDCGGIILDREASSQQEMPLVRP